MPGIILRSVVTQDDYSSIPSIISWFMGVVVLACVGAKLLMKRLMKLRFAIDDLMVILATVFSIGMVVTISIASSNGLGRRMASLTPVQLSKFQKSVYATDIIYGVTLFFSKASMLALLGALMHKKPHRNRLGGIACFLVIWLLTIVLCSALQCSLPNAWAIVGGHCFNQRAFRLYYGITNTITELLLLMIPISLMKDIQLPIARRATVIAILELRAVLLCPLILELYFQYRAQNDLTFTMWPFEVCRLFTQGFSIVFACVPYMKPFFMSLHHCMTRVDDERRRKWRETLKESSATGWKSYRVMYRSQRDSARVDLSHDQNSSEISCEHNAPNRGTIRITKTYDVQAQSMHDEHSMMPQSSRI